MRLCASAAAKQAATTRGIRVPEAWAAPKGEPTIREPAAPAKLVTLRTDTPEPKRPQAQPEPAAPAGPNRAQRMKESRIEILVELRNLGSPVFGNRPTPLAIGIKQAAVDLLAGVFKPIEVAGFLKWWTGRLEYLVQRFQGSTPITWRC